MGSRTVIEGNQRDQLDSKRVKGNRRGQLLLERGGVHETGSTVLGLMTTLTRQVRNRKGELVLAHASPSMERFLDSMMMDSYWDVFDDAGSAVAFLNRSMAGKLDVIDPTSLTNPRTDSR